MDVLIKEISPEILNALRALAHKNGKSLEEYARSVLERETQKIPDSDREYQNSLKQELTELEESELKHLEKEFENYEQLFPRR